MAIDCDTTDPVLLDRLRYALGDTITRVGRAPRILYLFAAERAGIEKMSSAKFVDEKGEKHQVEILGAGQQFVAYGIHPETGQALQVDRCLRRPDHYSRCWPTALFG